MSGAILLVEPAPGFLAHPSALDQRRDQRRRRECCLAPDRSRRVARLLITWPSTSIPAMSIVRKVALFGRPSARPVIASISSIEYSPDSQRPQRLDHTEQGDLIRDEVGRVLGDDDALAEIAIEEGGHAREHRGVGGRGRNHLDQAQVARRVEEVGAEPMTAEFVAAPFGECRDRDSRGVG